MPTGLYNRRFLEESAQREVLRATRQQANGIGDGLALLMIDIDHFKQVNDEHGHPVGDLVLQNIARILDENTRKVDTVGRWGGEEFLIICPGANIEGTVQLAEKLRECIARHELPVVGHKSASFGVSAYQPDDHANSLVARADAALYVAKHGGRNRVEVH